MIRKLGKMRIKNMNLKDYLLKKNISPPRFAVDTGISLSTIYRYMNGERPTLLKAERIQKATNGMVTVKDLRGS